MRPNTPLPSIPRDRTEPAPHAPRVLVRALATALLVAAGGPLAAQTPADSAAALGEHRPLDLSVAVRAGTLGYGVEVGKLVTGHLGVRAAAYLLTYHRAQAFDDVQYDANLNLRNASALVDLFPGNRGRFHLTGGIVMGRTELSGTGVPQGGTFDINGQTYASDQVGTLSGAARFPRLRPYAGIGWGSPARNRGRLGFSTDIGVVYGRPSVTFAATGMAADPQLRADLEAQRLDAQTQVDRYARFYPVMNWGLTYRF